MNPEFDALVKKSIEKDNLTIHVGVKICVFGLATLTGHELPVAKAPPV